MATPHAKKIVMDLLKGSKAQTGLYGFQDVISNTDDLLSDILIAPAYDNKQRADWAAWLERVGEIPVLGEYRRDTAQLPCVLVLREGDREPQRGGYVGDYIGEIEKDYTVETRRGAKFEEFLELHVWAGGASAPAERDVLYLILRELILRARRYFHAAGMTVCEWTGGQDGQLERPEHAPHIVHCADARLSYQVDVSWTEEEEAFLDVKGNLEGYADGRVKAAPFESDR